MGTKRCIAFGIFAAFLMALAVPVFPAESRGDEEGIPSTAVARLKIGKGTAWIRSGPSGEWEEAVSNYTLAERSRVSIPQGSEAEIQYRGSQSLILRGGSEVDIRQLGEKEVSYRLRSGQVVLSLPKEDFSPVRVTVPGNREVRVDTPGRYSLSTDGGTTRFLVRAGEGVVTGEDGSPVAVRAGDEAFIGEGIRIGRAETASPEPVPEATLTEPETEAGVPPAVAGELRQYGEWVPTPEYGYAWRPYVEDGWEPYYYGRWTWVAPYGWTWVGYEPWGWWPYHTGWWWPSPLYGWVWCPFHSAIHGHHARFFPANVRFVGKDRFVRWVPARPGERRADSRSFARGDTRLARWNRQVERGSVMVRRDGGPPMAWEGRSGGARARDGGAVRSTGPRGGNAGIARPRSGNYGAGVPSIQRGRSSRSFSGGAGRNLENPGFRRGPGRSSAVNAPAFRAGGTSREPVRGGFSRSPVSGTGSRGNAAGFRGSQGGEHRGFGGATWGGSGRNR
jgi:hypothetical protein